MYLSPLALFFVIVLALIVGWFVRAFMYRNRLEQTKALDGYGQTAADYAKAQIARAEAAARDAKSKL